MNTILTVIVAAGSGMRMGADMPKQFLSLNGEPIVMRTIRRMDRAVNNWLLTEGANIAADLVVDNSVGNHNDESFKGQFLDFAERIVDNIVDNHKHGAGHVNSGVNKIVLVLPSDHLELWSRLCLEYDFDVPHTVIVGGDTRFESVRNGLMAMPDADIVLVHDGVRPLVSDAVVSEVARAAVHFGAAVPVVAVNDSLRMVEGSKSRATDRASFRAVQTPQAFGGELLRRAYASKYRDTFTDDAAVVEHSGVQVALTRGDVSNIKITTPTDMMIAQVLLSNG